MLTLVYKNSCSAEQMCEILQISQHLNACFKICILLPVDGV